jgi:hypothetical protein
MAIEGVDYNLLFSAAWRAKDNELITVLEAAQKGQAQGFESNPDLVARAHEYLAKDQFLRNHPSRAATLVGLRPVAQQSKLWQHRPAGSSGLWRKIPPIRLGDKVITLTAPPQIMMPEDFWRHAAREAADQVKQEQELARFPRMPPPDDEYKAEIIAELSLRSSFKRHNDAYFDGKNFVNSIHNFLALKCGRHLSESEILFHLTEKGNRSLLPEIVQVLGTNPKELQQVAERLVKEGVLRPTEKSDIERAREVKEGKGPKPRGPVK